MTPRLPQEILNRSDPEAPTEAPMKKLDGDDEEFVPITSEGSNLLPDWHPSER